MRQNVGIIEANSRMRISGPDGNHSPTMRERHDDAPTFKSKEEIGERQWTFNHDCEELIGTAEDRVAGMIAKRIHAVFQYLVASTTLSFVLCPAQLRPKILKKPLCYICGVPVEG